MKSLSDDKNPFYSQFYMEFYEDGKIVCFSCAGNYRYIQVNQYADLYGSLKLGEEVKFVLLPPEIFDIQSTSNITQENVNVNITDNQTPPNTVNNNDILMMGNTGTNIISTNTNPFLTTDIQNHNELSVKITENPFL